MPSKVFDDISNGSGVILLTDRQTENIRTKQSYKRTLLKTIPPSLATLRCAGSNQMRFLGLQFHSNALAELNSARPDPPAAFEP